MILVLSFLLQHYDRLKGPFLTKVFFLLYSTFISKDLLFLKQTSQHENCHTKRCDETFHLISMSFIPWYDDFSRKMPKTYIFGYCRITVGFAWKLTTQKRWGLMSSTNNYIIANWSEQYFSMKMAKNPFLQYILGYCRCTVHFQIFIFKSVNFSHHVDTF